MTIKDKRRNLSKVGGKQPNKGRSVSKISKNGGKKNQKMTSSGGEDLKNRIVELEKKLDGLIKPIPKPEKPKPTFDEVVSKIKLRQSDSLTAQLFCQLLFGQKGKYRERNNHRYIKAVRDYHNLFMESFW